MSSIGGHENLRDSITPRAYFIDPGSPSDFNLGSHASARCDCSAQHKDHRMSRMKSAQTQFVLLSLGWLVSLTLANAILANAVLAQPAGDDAWARVTEDDRAIKIETDKLEAVIPKKNPKQWMTGIEKGSFLDKTTGFREVGDGLMVVDWLMEAGSDAELERPGDRPGRQRRRPLLVVQERDRSGAASYTRMSHGSSHRKRMVEGPQLCHRMKPVQPEIIRGQDFVAVKTTYKFEYAAPGRKPGSQWTQLIVFPKGERLFRVDGQDRQRERLARDVPAQRHAGLRAPRARATRSARCT